MLFWTIKNNHQVCTLQVNIGNLVFGHQWACGGLQFNFQTDRGVTTLFPFPTTCLPQACSVRKVRFISGIDLAIEKF